MSVAKKSFLVFLISLAVASFFWVRHLRRRTTKIQGAVITRNADPRKQLPIADVEVTANDGFSMVQSKSDASGLFTIVLRKPLLRGQIISLQFQHRDYAPLSLTVNAPGNITVAALTPVVRTTPIVDNSARQTIGNTVVRYSIKTASTVPIGSAVRAFEAVNEGGVPCAAHLQCSPDGKWKAATGSTSLDAGEGNDDPLRGKKSDLGAKAKAQNRLVSIVKGDIMSARQIEWSTIVAGRKSNRKCRLGAFSMSGHR